jgi:hypothetical protein
MLVRVTRLVLFSVLAIGLATGIASAAPGANQDAARLCQKGGWATLQRADGTPFTNQGECVAYAAHGGTLAPIPSRTVSLSFVPTDAGGAFCGMRIAVTGFTPGSYTVFFVFQDQLFAGPQLEVGTDGTGSVTSSDQLQFTVPQGIPQTVDVDGLREC